MTKGEPPAGSSLVLSFESRDMLDDLRAADDEIDWDALSDDIEDELFLERILQTTPPTPER